MFVCILLLPTKRVKRETSKRAFNEFILVLKILYEVLLKLANGKTYFDELFCVFIYVIL